jgi:hypothetical protein
VPQTKECPDELGGDATEKVHRRLHFSPPILLPSEAIIRELGRAYMSMAQAKQCLLESARKLEGTNQEEDFIRTLDACRALPKGKNERQNW